MKNEAHRDPLALHDPDKTLRGVKYAPEASPEPTPQAVVAANQQPRIPLGSRVLVMLEGVYYGDDTPAQREARATTTRSTPFWSGALAAWCVLLSPTPAQPFGGHWRVKDLEVVA